MEFKEGCESFQPNFGQGCFEAKSMAPPRSYNLLKGGFHPYSWDSDKWLL